MIKDSTARVGESFLITIKILSFFITQFALLIKPHIKRNLSVHEKFKDIISGAHLVCALCQERVVALFQSLLRECESIKREITSVRTCYANSVAHNNPGENVSSRPEICRDSTSRSEISPTMMRDSSHTCLSTSDEFFFSLLETILVRRSKSVRFRRPKISILYREKESLAIFCNVASWLAFKFLTIVPFTKDNERWKAYSVDMWKDNVTKKIRNWQIARKICKWKTWRQNSETSLHQIKLYKEMDCQRYTYI